MGVTVISSAAMAVTAGAEPEFVPRVIPAPAHVPAPAIHSEEAEEEEAPPAAASYEPEEEQAPAAEPALVAAAAYAGADDEEQVSLIGMAPHPERPPAEAQPAPVRPPRAPRQPRILVSASVDPRPAAAVASRREERQETLQFEPVTRGRFEKSEPTIVDGQDLDVPTYLRRNLKVS
jgi:cell division protein FtsZ